MASEEAKQIYKQRAATAECVNAQARNRGLLRMPVRGLGKVRSVVGLFVLAHNLMRMAVLAPQLIGWGSRALGKALQEAGVAIVGHLREQGRRRRCHRPGAVRQRQQGRPERLMVMGAVMLGGIITGKPPVNLSAGSRRSRA
jgi:hypothetical protein